MGMLLDSRLIRVNYKSPLPIQKGYYDIHDLLVAYKCPPYFRQTAKLTLQRTVVFYKQKGLGGGAIFNVLKSGGGGPVL